MVTHFTAKERAFVDALKGDTGRDLNAWMAAIRASGFVERNHVIDWLRQQGFTFAHASWLERIHYNGGRLIYAEELDKPSPARQPSADQAEQPRPSAASDAGEIDGLLAAAKAYRPLCQMILNELIAAASGAAARPLAGHITVGLKRTFAALHPTPKGARLMLALGQAAPAGWEHSKLTGAPLDALRGLTHMKVMNDARQVDSEFKALIRLSVQNCES